MERVRFDDVENVMGPAAVKRRLTEPLGVDGFAVNYYELAPGDAFGFAYHRHPDQEEVFVVQSGTVTFETEDGPVAVGPDEAVRFGPNEFQRGRNEGEVTVRALALGAPRDHGPADKLRDCETCGSMTPQAIERAPEGEGLVTRCEDCGTVTGRFVHGEVDREP